MSRGAVIWVILVSVLLGYFIGSKWCSSPSASHTEVDTTDTLITVEFDTVYVDTVIEKERIQLVEVTKAELLAEVDTHSIVESYLQRHEYLANYQDSSIDLELRPIVQFGQLDSIGVKYQITHPIQTQLIRKQVTPSWQFYGGVSSTWTPKAALVAPMLQVNYRDNYSFGLGYSTWSNGGSLTLNASFKLFDLP